MDELAVLFPEEGIKLRKIQIKLKPCKTKIIRNFTGTINEYINYLATSVNNLDFYNTILQDNGSKAFKDMLYLLNNCWLINLEETKKIAKKLDLEFTEDQNLEERKIAIIDELDYDETLFLFTEFIRMNRSFFDSLAQRIILVLQQNEK